MAQFCHTLHNLREKFTHMIIHASLLAPLFVRLLSCSLILTTTHLKGQTFLPQFMIEINLPLLTSFRFIYKTSIDGCQYPCQSICVCVYVYVSHYGLFFILIHNIKAYPKNTARRHVTVFVRSKVFQSSTTAKFN